MVDEALALCADAVALRHPHFVEINQARVAAVHADLFDLLAHGDKTSCFSGGHGTSF